MKKLLAVCAVLAVASSAHANLLVNGGFETGDMTGWVKDQPFGNSTWDNPATANPFGIPIAPASGTYMASAISGWDTSRNGSMILQTFYNPGGDTTVSFEGRAYNAFVGNPVSPFDTGVQIGFDPTGAGDIYSGSIVWLPEVWATGMWENRSQTFLNVPAGNNTVLIRSIHKWGIEWNMSFADDVSVTVVPEPSSMLALASGLGAMVAAFARKR